MSEPLAITQDGPVVRVRMTRPDRRNAFDAALIAALTEAFTTAQSVIMAANARHTITPWFHSPVSCTAHAVPTSTGTIAAGNVRGRAPTIQCCID